MEGIVVLAPGDVMSNLMPTGVGNVDQVLGGGFPVGDMLLLLGPAGSGKTVMALRCNESKISKSDGCASFRC